MDPIEVDFFIYINILVYQAFNISQHIVVKTLPHHHIYFPNILYIGNLRKYINNLNLLEIINKYNFVPLNKISMTEAINLYEPLLNVHLKKIIITARYKFTVNKHYDSPFYVTEQKSNNITIVGTGINSTVILKDFLHGIYSCKKYLQYQTLECIYVSKIINFTDHLQFEVIYSDTKKENMFKI